MTESKQYCSFFVGELYFGVNVCDVQEVIRYQPMTAVPLAPAEVAGLINLRGQIVTAIDLRRRLNLPERAAGKLPMNVVVRTADGAVSLLVDEIGEVLQAEADSFENIPQTLNDVAREFIQGIHKLKDCLLLVLNTEKAVDLSAVAA